MRLSKDWAVKRRVIRRVGKYRQALYEVLALTRLASIHHQKIPIEADLYTTGYKTFVKSIQYFLYFLVDH